MKKIWIILIFVFALFLRVYKLGNYPVGFLWDEASLGYNAYSILKTGRDEYGKILPIIFKSFGDYKPGLYVYLTVPSIAIFGLNEFSVRLPSALLGTVSVVILYLLVKEMFLHESTRIGTRINADSLPIVSAVLLAVSPWHISFSRGAWELNIMLTEIMLALYLVISYLNCRRIWRLYLGAIIFLFSLITYQAAKLLMPALLAALIFFFRRELTTVAKKEKRNFLIVITVGYIAFNLVTFLGGKSGRLKVMSVFSYPRSDTETQMIQSQENNRDIYDIFHGKPVFFLRSVLGRYFNHFSGRFLFFDGDWSNPRNGVAYHGVMYLFDALFLMFGLAVLFGGKRRPLDNLMLFWLVLAPLPSALTRDSISSVRSFTMVIPLVYIAAVGVNSTYGFLRKDKSPCFPRFFSPLILYSLFIIQLLLIARFLDMYFVHDPKINSNDRLFGYKQMVNYIKPMVNSKNKVVITTKYGQPYIFYLFYSQYNPEKYQLQAVLKENPYGDVGEVERIDNIEFRKMYWPQDRGTTNSLFVGDQFDLPINDVVGQNNITLLKQLNFLDNSPAFRIVETK